MVTADATADALSLLSAHAVRTRAHRLLDIGLNDKLPHFRVDLGRLDDAVDRVLAATRTAYPKFEIPFHSRWRHFEAGGVRQTVVELDEAFLFVTAAGDGSCLAVLSDADSDVGQVAYEMTLLVKRVGVHLGSSPRTDLPSGG